ncbi:MAG: hypothetical protein N3F07_03775 [Candidatus Micrarchaeota archaeon]|nr:hypothetical protein [Candidatus Micrarchaeota archaeon]
MAKIDVFEEIQSSANLIRKHYLNVIVPIIILLLFNAGAGGSIGSGASDFLGGLRESKPSYLPGAMLPSSFSEAALFIIIFIALLVLLAIVGLLLHQAVSLYVFNYFHSLLHKRKIDEGWQSQIKRFFVKALVLGALGLLILVATLGIPLLMIYSSFVSSAQKDIVQLILQSIFWLVLGAAAYAAAMFLISPLWVLYAIEGRGFFQSLKASVSLVLKNLVPFFLLWVIFAVLYAISAIISLVSALCCISWLVSPVVEVFLSLLYGVTLMSMLKKMQS